MLDDELSNAILETNAILCAGSAATDLNRTNQSTLCHVLILGVET